jgi:Sec-independent protein secretion pathway component TatC
MDEVHQAQNVNDEEDGGGAVKPFLDHLEDLRWTLIKGGSALLIAMIVCLAAGNYLARILEWPLVGTKAPMVVICFLLGALLTTHEVLTQVVMAVPLYVLYEISVWIAGRWGAAREETRSCLGRAMIKRLWVTIQTLQLKAGLSQAER